MPFTINDIQHSARTYSVTAGNAITTSATRVFTMSVTAGADAASLTIHNAATASGGSPITIKAVLETTTTLDFGPTGIRLDTALSTAATGTTPTTVVTYLAE